MNDNPKETDHWIEEHEELLESLMGDIDPFVPEMFLPPDCKDSAMIVVAQACCDILNKKGFVHLGGKNNDWQSPTERFGNAAVAALENKSADFFMTIAKGLKKQEEDRQVVGALIGAIEEHGRIPSNKEVMKHLAGVSEKTMQRRLREIGVVLPQAKRNGTEPRG